MMSAKAAQAFTLSTTVIPALSLAPFLYQTRTLSTIKWSKPIRPRCPSAYPRRNFSSIPRYQYAIDQNNTPHTTTTTWSPVAPSAVPEVNENQVHDSNAQLHDRQNLRHEKGDPQSMGRTRWNSTTSRQDPSTPRREYNRTYPDDFSSVAETKPIDFDEEVDEDFLINRDEIADLTRSHPLGESTITDTERYAFQKVFRDIFGRNQGSGTGIGDGFGGVMPPKNTDTAKLKEQTLATASRTNTMTRYEMVDMVNRYPAPLRAAAARAIGLTEVEAEGEEDIADEEPELDMEKVEMLRQPERERVETLMKDATTDFELWKVMEKEVFSLIPNLGLQDVEKPREQPRKIKSRSKSPKEPKESVVVEPATAEDSAVLQKFSANEDGISPLALYGPLYPSYLLLGLRLLDRSFAKSSPLTLTLLPKIKSLGLISHVLGASSQLYNELLQIHRYRYDDYRGILQLLSEMEHSGIEFDHETLDIVQDIQRTQISVRKGGKGPAIQTLWTLPEFAPNKFKVWYDKIGAEIKSRTMAQGTSMRY